MSDQRFVRDFSEIGLGDVPLVSGKNASLGEMYYDERDPGVKEMIRLAVEGCRRNGVHSGLCGQAPSDYPDMAEFLVEIGIDSMRINPDSVLAVTRAVLDLESRPGR